MPTDPCEFEDRLIEAVAAHERVDQVWDEMTSSQQVIAAHLMEGEKPHEIAHDLGVTDQAVRQIIQSLRGLFKLAETQHQLKRER